MALSLARAGYFKRDPQCVLNAPISLVLDSYYYEAFVQDYQNCSFELNRPKEENKKQWQHH